MQHKKTKRKKIAKKKIVKRKNPTLGTAKTVKDFIEILPKQVIFTMREYLDELHSDYYGDTEPGEILFDASISDKNVITNLNREMSIKDFLKMYQDPEFRSYLRFRTNYLKKQREL